MKTKAKTLTIVELLDANRQTLGEIKRGDRSLCWNPLAPDAEEEYGVKELAELLSAHEQSVLLITEIVEESAGSLKEGKSILQESLNSFYGNHDDED